MAISKKKTRDRLDNEVNAGSMADIAFLLLIFFLVTTTILEDKGILVKLPPWSEEPPEMEKLKDRNVLNVLINANNELLVEGDPLEVEQLREETKKFILNPDNSKDLAETPKNAIISLQNDRGTEYQTYIEVYNELKAAYNELHNERAKLKFGKEYEDLTLTQKREVRDEIPMVISEAEPTEFGEETSQ